eukprot:4907631-Amphidinium_carterae.1
MAQALLTCDLELYPTQLKNSGSPSHGDSSGRAVDLGWESRQVAQRSLCDSCHTGLPRSSIECTPGMPLYMVVTAREALSHATFQKLDFPTVAPQAGKCKTTLL